MISHIVKGTGSGTRRFIVLVAMLVVTPVLSAESIRRSVDFTGSWELDYQLSDHSNEKIQWLYVQAKSEAEREIARAQNNRGYRMDPQVGNFQAIIGLGRLAEKIAEATVLTISQEAEHIVIDRNDDFALICDFKDFVPSEVGIGVEACGWQQDQLTFKIGLPDGLFVYHRLSLAADRSRLNIATTVRIEGIRYPFTLNRVYMPFEPGEGQYNCQYSIANQTSCTLGAGDQ